MQINVLGTEYTVIIKKYDETDFFERESADGYCSSSTKEIVVCDMTTCKDWEHEPEQSAKNEQKRILRHEIIHAFLSESGLQANAGSPSCSWALNEEMIDWLAIQGPKIYQAWREADAL